MITVSRCCFRHIVKGYRYERPLGAKEYNGAGIAYTIDICESCGKEAEETADVHECCGLEICECDPEESEIEDELEKLRETSI